MTVSSVVDQKVEARGSKLCESLFHSIDKGIERSDVAGIELQRSLPLPHPSRRQQPLPHRLYGCE